LTATKAAVVYGVSEKAVRDIWKGRTWARETWRFDTSRPLQLKLVGRPKGCKDRNPRKKRVNAKDAMALPARLLCSGCLQAECTQCSSEKSLSHYAWQVPSSQSLNVLNSHQSTESQTLQLASRTRAPAFDPTLRGRLLQHSARRRWTSSWTSGIASGLAHRTRTPSAETGSRARLAAPMRSRGDICSVI
jgi:hypothetical protein